MMGDETGVGVGDVASTVILSPCVGGLLRTWDESNETTLWSVPDAGFLLSRQGSGLLGRSRREERRFFEAGLLVPNRQTLMLQGRFPTQTNDGSMQLDGSMLSLEPATAPADSAIDDFRTLLSQAIRHCISSGEFLVLEKGGWDAPTKPYCLFVAVQEDGGNRVNVIETAPQPLASEMWSPHCISGQAGATLRAPMTQETIDVAPLVMIEAIATWGLQPWDLALVFGSR
ncbi:MAG: hypothetical protein U0R81_09935 [Mycobacterium sp.]